MDKFFEVATKDMNAAEARIYKELFSAHISPETLAQIDKTARTQAQRFVFCTDISSTIHYTDVKMGTPCFACKEPLDECDDIYVCNDNPYCDPCHEDNFFWCEACGEFYERKDQCGFNWCIDCGAKCGTLFPNDVDFVAEDDRIPQIEQWIQQNVNPTYSYDKDYADWKDANYSDDN